MSRSGRAMALAMPLVALAALSFGVARKQSGRLVCTFSESAEGWQAVPTPGGVPLDLSLTEGPPARRSLRARYTLESRKIAGVLRNVSGSVGNGLKLRLRTDSPTSVVVGCIERDGSAYVHIVQTTSGKWSNVQALYATFALSDDSKDENGRLDPDQIGTIVVADAGGFLPVQPTRRELLLDDVEFGANIKAQAAKPYVPLLPTGRVSPSGARATSGVNFVPGKYGKAFVPGSPGALCTVRVTAPKGPREWRWEQGTIEFWVSTRQPIAAIPDFTGLIALQQEPFMQGFRGSLLAFLTKSGQIAFMINGSTDLLAATPALNWAPGSWHHVALTWGPDGMRVHVDGLPGPRNVYAGGPSQPTMDLVIGGHAWTVLSHRPAPAAFDDLRVSARARTTDEIKALMTSNKPAPRDADTIALERFDGSPEPPARFAGGSDIWNTHSAGRAVTLKAIPATRSGSALGMDVRTVSGTTIRRKTPIDSNGIANLGTLRDPGFYQVQLGDSTGWFRVAGPAATPQKGSLLFGASACFAESQDSERFFKLAKAAGVRTLRMPFEWFEIEPDEGRFVWDKYDRIVRWADGYGVELIPTFIWEKAQPAWAGPGEAKSGPNSERWPPTDTEKWRRFVRAVVRRYKASVHWWIPANEPNLARYWHPRPDPVAYVALLRATKEAAREADPKARILGLSASGIDLQFMEACFAAGALQHCDAVGIHPYICPHSPDEVIPINILDPGSKPGTFRDGLLAAGALIRKHGGKQKLWLDEAGQPYRDDFIAPNWGRPEKEAAGILAKEMIEALASGVVERVLWFSFFGGEYGSFALVRPDGSPTMPLAAYCAAQRFLTSAAFVRDGTRPDGVVSRIYSTPRGRLEIVWTGEGTGVIRLRSGEVAYDTFGFRLKPARGRDGVTATAWPMYILGG